MFSSKIYKSWKAMQEEKFRRLLDFFGIEFLKDTLKGRVLDIGYGSGFFEEFLRKQGFDVKNFIGVDMDREMIRHDKNSIQKIVADGNNLPFRPEGFDNIICFDTAHLINSSFSGVLRRNGFALVSMFFNPQNYQKRKEMLKGKLRGLEIISEFVSRGRENEIFVLARKH